MAADGSIVIEIKGDAKGLQATLKKLKSIAKDALGGAFDDANSSLKKLVDNTNKVNGSGLKKSADSVKELGNSAETAATEFDELADAWDSMDFGDLGSTESELEKIGDAAQKTSDEFDELADAWDSMDFGDLGNTEADLRSAANAADDLGDGLREAGQAGDSLGNAAGDASRLKTSLDGAADDADRLGDELEKAGREGKNAGSGIASGFTVAKGALAGIAADVAMRLVDAFAELGKEALSSADAITKFGTTMEFAGFAEDEITRVSSAMKTYASETVYDLETVLNTAAQLGANGVKDYDKLTQAAGNLNAVAGGNAETFKSVAMVLTQTAGAGKLTTENWNQLADAIPGASGVLQEAMLKNGAYTGNFREAMEKGEITAEEFNDAIMNLGFTEAAQEAASSTATIEGAVGNLKASIVDGLAGILTESGGMTAITGLISGIAGVIDGAMPLIQGAIEGISMAFQGVRDAINSAFTPEQQAAISGFFSTLSSALIATPFAAVSAVVTVFSGVLSGLITVVGAVADAFDKVPDSLSEVGKWFSQLPGTISTALNAALSSVVSWASGVVSNMSNAASSAVNAVQNYMSQLPGKISSALSGALSALVSWGSQMVSNARAKMGEVASAIVNRLKSLPGEMLTIGGQIIQGLINGITNKLGALKAKAESIVSSLSGPVRKLLGIASPSKLFKQFGQWVVEGLVIGIENREESAAQAISAVAKRVAGEIERLNKELQTIEDEGAKEALRSRKESLEALSNEYTGYIDDVLKERDRLTEALSNTDLFEKDNDGGFQLRDLNQDIQAIRDYSDALQSLTARGIDTGLYSDILAMDVEAASQYAKALLDLSDEAYADYIAAYQEKAKLAAEVSEGIYAPLMDKVEASFNDKLPEDMWEAAEGSMDALAESIEANGRAAVQAAAQIADAINAELARINASGAIKNAVVASQSSTSTRLASSATHSAEAKRAAANAESSNMAAALAMMMSSVSPEREIVLNINGKEAARALVPDIRAVEDQSPRIVSD